MGPEPNRNFNGYVERSVSIHCEYGKIRPRTDLTILCLVRDLRNGAWAAFADCLIISDEHDQGPSLRTPLQKNFMERETFGFTESALEEKIGFISKDLVFGWSGRRDLALAAVQAVRERISNDEIVEMCISDENCYFVAINNEDGTQNIIFFGPRGRVQTIQAHGYEFRFAASGSRILEDLRFTSKDSPLGFGAFDVVAAEIQALSKFLNEEMAGRTSQFYSLRTGGRYQIISGTSQGARRLLYCVNHWHQSELEPLLHSISVPIIKEQHELFASIVGNPPRN
jgi:hypothetical protein